jgi:hypothetical protein
VLLSLLLIAAFQCPDGSPPPCGRPARAPTAPAIDPNRIAVLPFHVTTADTLLGEGVAELLSAEFTGERGPRAAHMGTVLRAWRQAGGAPRAPLPTSDAIRAARAIGAGLLVDGTIVGIGQRLTVSANVVTVPAGQTRRATPVSGSADSLDVLLRRFSTNLIAAAGGESRATERGVLTESPAAMRYYLEGLSAWRRYQVDAAAGAFERAFAEDSTFARAALMRYVTSLWGAGTSTRWDRRAWALRDRLSAQDRTLLIAYLGENFPAPRTPAQALADRERAVQLLPESPEAHYVLADWLFHYGAAADIGNRLERAIAGFRRSLALDTQQTVLTHLVEAAAMAGDTALLRSLKPALDHADAGTWSSAWLAAAVTQDAAWLATLRRSPQPGGGLALLVMPVAGVSPALIDEAVDMNGRNNAGLAAGVKSYAAVIQGRPSAAARIDWTDWGNMFFAAVLGDGDTAAAVQALAHIVEAGHADSGGIAGSECGRGLWSLRQPGPPAVNEAMMAHHGQEECAATLGLARIFRSGTGNLDSALAATDSLLRLRIAPNAQPSAGPFVLAKIWESRGDLRRARAALRLHNNGLTFNWGEVTEAREEGRLAAIAGDTAAAIRAYRHYLVMRREAEPPMIPQRDSVTAELARLERRR